MTEVRRIDSATNPLLRLAASSYLNSAPLIWSFLHGSRRSTVEYVEAVPAKCAELLSLGSVEAALVPVIEYQRISNIVLVPDVCVASKEQVRSVLLVSRNSELKDIRSVALDESSRTSATLVRIIFREFLDHEPAWTTHAPRLEQMLESNDAALIIGDPAMVFPQTALKVWDMARLWRNYTDLGFVFAMWVVNNDAVDRARQVDFAAARDEGLASKDEIVEYYKKLLGLSEESIREYLDSNICFDVDDQLQRGLSLYYQLAHKHLLIPELKPLKTLVP